MFKFLMERCQCHADPPWMLSHCDIAFSMLDAPGQLQTAYTPSLRESSAGVYIF